MTNKSPILESLEKEYEKFRNTGTDSFVGFSVDDIIRMDKFRQLRIERYKLVIDPDFKLYVNTNSRTGISYINAKGYWLDDEGKKVRSFNRLICRLEDYNKNEVMMKSVAKNEMSKMGFKKYNETYNQ